MSAASNISANLPAVEAKYTPPSVARHGAVSALSVVGGIAVLALGLAAMALVGILAGLLIVVGSLPLWGWACVQNKTLYS
jgi:hypothetical protein